MRQNPKTNVSQAIHSGKIGSHDRAERQAPLCETCVKRSELARTIFWRQLETSGVQEQSTESQLVQSAHVGLHMVSETSR